ncbi:unnamed protein product [Rotaria socialis]|uniref:Uncharacterized protein n=1 Tax=Rotaria socialis TaxID=392032 RepID=A0A821B5V4_9BILA|nr:unnamed protein product [Rotaria socialis]CAF4665273.1 unnamed protein product [Rotaria socialis]CAF4687802.1 unnamed protein product [Rotaria socialis]CAF4956091.1 unnamed protein product [Rotaria socialis]
MKGRPFRSESKREEQHEKQLSKAIDENSLDVNNTDSVFDENQRKGDAEEDENADKSTSVTTDDVICPQLTDERMHEQRNRDGIILADNLPKVDPITRKNIRDDLFQLIQMLNDDSVDQNVAEELKKSTSRFIQLTTSNFSNSNVSLSLSVAPTTTFQQELQQLFNKNYNNNEMIIQLMVFFNEDMVLIE